ncbi:MULTISPECIES: LysE family translocator [Ectothiorhodospira]|nr:MULTISPECIES: LysE family translocator [Ectothiorhodospira]MCG5495633.1 LysE family translocator [Ectothiorhodospira variabilis]MCG5498838.1 LysE family translocator [Ectothiorhodospira variabilis]MCG5504694.1 LysE family translocator [Ectothiorhodospira variabilis]MCG5507851.1 LysE family translocator [Ectothiorhodospira variabilis]MCG5525786.1 LysE family translocator [Ectothiorhodospira haloalkaliphila]
MTETLAVLLMGAALGLSAGVAPGPLLALVISETLQHGLRAGMKVALAPLLTDLPIILLTLFILAQLAHVDQVLGGLSIIGAGVVAWLGWDSLRFRPAGPGAGVLPRERSLQKAALANMLSPHPYLFWLSVGGPIVIRASESGPWVPVGFVTVFYVLLIGAKVGIALMTAWARPWLAGRGYVMTVRALGVVLLALAAVLLYEGVRTLLG